MIDGCKTSTALPLPGNSAIAKKIRAQSKRRKQTLAAAALITFSGIAHAAPSPTKPASCSIGSFEAEVTAGQPFTQPIGSGLVFFLQPIASGWILRVLPTVGPVPLLGDYAELATPPYKSVSPLSLSTDFAFRAQDAIGWNPRRFRFTTSPEKFKTLEETYTKFEMAGATPPAPLQVELSSEVSQAAEGSLTIVDARLIPGTANQSSAAGAVASHFTSTAHTVIQPGAQGSSPLGRILWMRFRVELVLPPEFRPAATLKLLPHLCGTH